MQTATSNYINNHKNSAELLDIYLINGLRMTGRVEEFDDEGIIIDTGQLIMRSSIMTIQVHKK